MTSLGYILLTALLVVLPAEKLWKTLRATDAPTPTMTVRLLRSIRVVVVLTVFLGALW